MSTGQWYAGTSDDGPFGLGPYDKKQDCIADAKEEFADEIANGDTIYLGQAETVTLGIDGHCAAENAGEHSYDDLYEDALHNYCRGIKPEQYAELTRDLTAVFHQWCEKHVVQYQYDVIEPKGAVSL